MDNDKQHIERMYSEILFMEKALKNVSKDDFLNDDILQHAIAMSLITIGESANHLSEEFIENNSDINWYQIIGVRNVAAHGYWQLSMKQIWQAISDDIPFLKEYLEEL